MDKYPDLLTQADKKALEPNGFQGLQWGQGDGDKGTVQLSYQPSHLQQNRLAEMFASRFLSQSNVVNRRNKEYNGIIIEKRE